MSMGGEEPTVPGYLATVLALCTIAVLLNGLVIFLVFRFGRANSIDILVINLSITDIIHSAVIMPVHFKNVSVSHEDFYGGNDVCRMIMFMPLFTIMAAISTIVALAADRYRIMVVRTKPLGRKKAWLMIAVIWLIACVTSSPQLYEYSVCDRFDDERNMSLKSCGSCGTPENFETIYASIVLIVSYILPLLIVVVCYAKITRLVWTHVKSFGRAQMVLAPAAQGSSGGNNNQHELTSRKLKVFKMSMSITFSFAALWAPYFVLFTLTEVAGLDNSVDSGALPHLIGRILTVLSTIVNPLVYLYFNEAFRSAIRKGRGCLPYLFCNTSATSDDSRTSEGGSARRTGFTHGRQSRKVGPATSSYIIEDVN